MSQQKSYFEILAKPEEFKKVENDLLYRIKMDEKEISIEKGKEFISAIETMWNIKASFKF